MGGLGDLGNSQFDEALGREAVEGLFACAVERSEAVGVDEGGGTLEEEIGELPVVEVKELGAGERDVEGVTGEGEYLVVGVPGELTGAGGVVGDELVDVGNDGDSALEDACSVAGSGDLANAETYEQEEDGDGEEAAHQ